MKVRYLFHLFFILITHFMLQCIGLENGLDREENNYVFIKQLLDQYKRPLTVLSVTNNAQDYSFNIAQDYNAVCVMIPINKQIQSDLFESCQMYDLDNTILLGALEIPKDLKRMSECEHIDIILAMNNVLEQYSNSWQQILEALFDMGDYLILEINDSDANKQNYFDYIKSQNISILQEVYNNFSTIYLLNKSSGKVLQRTNWIYKLNCKIHKAREYVIKSTFIEKMLIKRLSYDWFPGINLITFKMTGGLLPNSDQIKKGIEEVKNLDHTDWMPQNMILQGKRIVLIDGNDKAKYLFFSDEQCQKLLKWIDLSKPNELVSFFNDELANGIPKNLIDWGCTKYRLICWKINFW